MRWGIRSSLILIFLRNINCDVFISIYLGTSPAILCNTHRERGTQCTVHSTNPTDHTFLGLDLDLDQLLMIAKVVRLCR